MGFYDVAESKFLYICVIFGIAYVLAVSFYYLKKCLKRGKELGISRQTMKAVAKSSATFSLIPSISIVAGLVTLAALLGTAWPWFRLSVVGSVSYEIMASDMALKTLDVNPATAAARAFGLVMFVMSIGIAGSHIFDILAVEKIHLGMVKLKETDRKWGALSSSIFMTALMVVFMVPLVLTGGAYLMTLLTSMAVCALLGIVVNKTKAAWLNNFILAICLITAMASSLMWEKLLS